METLYYHMINNILIVDIVEQNLVIEGASGRLKSSRFRILFRKCESNKETVKLFGMTCVMYYIICNKPWWFNSQKV